MFFRHRHGHGQGGFPVRRVGALVVKRGEDLRLEARQQIRRVAYRRQCGETHCRRAAHARLALRPQVRQSRPRHMRAGAGIGPAERMHLVRAQHAVQLMPGRVILHFVDAVPVPVMRLQFWRMAVGKPRQGLHPRRTHARPAAGQPRLGPASTKCPHRLAQGNIRAPGTEIAQQRWLVQDLMCGVAGHFWSPLWPRRYTARGHRS